MLDFVLVMTLVELLQSAGFVTWVYGPAQGFLALLRPPLAAYINGIATFRAAYAWYSSRRSGQAMQWSKTAHFFPTAASGGVPPSNRSDFGRSEQARHEELHLALEEQRHSREALGETLVRLGFVKERDVIEAFAEQTGTTTVLNDDLFPDVEVLAILPEELARRLCGFRSGSNTARSFWP